MSSFNSEVFERGSFFERKRDWLVEEVEGLLLLRSPVLNSIDWLVHAFTTRHGGASPAPLDSFNLGRHWHSEESKEDALRNRRKLCTALGLDHDCLIVPGQQHTANVRWLDSRELLSGPPDLAAVDGLATDEGGLALLLHFADCVPVMIVDCRRQRLCVIHAGWRGTAAGIVRQGIQSMIDRGSNAVDLVVAIGPAIDTCCFETGADVAEQLLKGAGGDPGLEDSIIQWRNNRAYPDLKAINAIQAMQAGVPMIDICRACTACNSDMFYSHRREAGKTGRQGAVAGKRL